MYASLIHYQDLAVIAEEWRNIGADGNNVTSFNTIARSVCEVNCRMYPFCAFYVVATEKRKELDTPDTISQSQSSHEKVIRVLLYLVRISRLLYLESIVCLFPISITMMKLSLPI